MIAYFQYVGVEDLAFEITAKNLKFKKYEICRYFNKDLDRNTTASWPTVNGEQTHTVRSCEQPAHSIRLTA